MCYSTKDIDYYRHFFNELGIEEDEKILGILNCLDQITEIGYSAYKKGIKIND